MNRLLSKIIKQRAIGPWLGGAKNLLMRTVFYISAINFLLLAVTAYHTTLRPYLPISFWGFLGILVAILVVAMVFEYTIVLPSSMVFLNRQVYKHKNPLVEDVLEIKEKLERIEAKLTSLTSLERPD